MLRILVAALRVKDSKTRQKARLSKVHNFVFSHSVAVTFGANNGILVPYNKNLRISRY